MGMKALYVGKGETRTAEEVVRMAGERGFSKCVFFALRRCIDDGSLGKYIRERKSPDGGKA